MIKLTKNLLNTLPMNTRIRDIKAFYMYKGKELAWTGHASEIELSEFDALKKDLSQDKSGLHWTGQLIFK